VLAPTPPPDVDVEAWRSSLASIEAWRPSRIALTHFGAFERAGEHLAALREQLTESAQMAGELDAAGFASAVRARVAASAGAQTAAAYEQAMPPEQSYHGLRRYLSSREPVRPSA
jgi:hypothetical protein